MKTRDTEQLLRLLKDNRDLDFSGISPAVIEGGISHRLKTTGITTCLEYYRFISEHPEEYDHLVKALTINVSFFFRDPLVFDHLAEIVYPQIVKRKAGNGERDMRVWSAGCASGEEPYSIAIGLKELSSRVDYALDYYIFGTDLNIETLAFAESAIFLKPSVENIRFGYMKYFNSEDGRFILKDEIRRMVSFSRHDLLDKKNMAPPESIFADFDMVLCRNVLIYFTRQFQDMALDKLYRSLTRGGYLVLGEAEVPSEKYRGYFKKVDDCCHIYQKVR